MSQGKQFYSKIQDEIASLAESIHDVVGKFRELQHPLAESHEKVPQATQQLDKISEQTEAATHKMLDTVEIITEREQEVAEGLRQILKEVSGKSKVNEKIKSVVSSLVGKVNANRNDAFSIMDALQFQDITAQQVNYAAALLEEIEGKLQKIISVVNGKDATEDEDETASGRERVYDPHADLFNKKTDQKDIDDLFQNKEEISKS